MTEERLRQILGNVAAWGTYTEAEVTEILAALAPVPTSPNRELFYRLVAALQQPATVRYTPQRVTKLRQRLKTFTAQELERAAKAVSDDDFLMGDNPGRRKYGTIDYLLRNDEIVDKWLAEAGESGPSINLAEAQF